MDLNELKAALKSKAAIIKNNLGDSATFKQAQNAAHEVGDILTALIKNNINIDTATAEEIIEIIKPLLLSGYTESADIAALVQQLVNTRAGISFNPILPEGDVSRIENLTEKLIEDSGAGWLIDNDVLENLCNSAVLDTMRLNAEFQNEAGLTVTVSRTTDGHCCEWCDSVAGVYPIDKIPRNFWAVHKDCTCYIDYKPSRGKWSRISYYTDADGKRRKITNDF